MRRAHQLSLMLLVGIAACGDQSSTSVFPRSTASSPSEAKAPPSGPVNVNVTTTLYDADALGNPLLTRSDDYNGAGFATYAPIGGVHGGLSSHVDGAWQLYIGNQTARTLHLMLADAGLPFADDYYYSSVEMASRCFTASGDTLNIQLLAAGASYTNCSLILDFDAGKPVKTYKLAMGPLFANTGRASVTCDAVTGSYCTSWTIVPNDAAPNPRVAILTAGAGTTSLDGKSYTNSYRVTAAQ